jgi:uncharacterized YigZ family protein
MEEGDFYYTIKEFSEGLFKDRGSRFIALAFPVSTEEEAKEKLLQVKKKYYDARHHCYAFRINPEKEFSKSSDDGEPSGTAGKPILNQLLSKKLFNVLVVVVRYFGGTKLGTSGLINAYKSATKDAIENATVLQKIITRSVKIGFEYPLMNNVMRLVKEENLKIISQKFELSCELTLEVEKSRESLIRKKFSSIYGVFLM